MSDIRAQSRRDAEFDRLADEIVRDLEGMSESCVRTALRRVWELGQKHGRDKTVREMLTRQQEMPPGVDR